MLGLAAPDWRVERDNWPFAEHSRFVCVGQHRWHIQRFGQGPKILCLHGTAASSHSFAALGTRLSPQCELFFVDLPSHGFTQSPFLRSVTAQSLASDLANLIAHESFHPDIIVGHSAGAVVAFEIAKLLNLTPMLVLINGAFRTFEGLASLIAPAMAKLMHINPLTAVGLSYIARADDRSVRRILKQTGSELSDDQIACYARLLSYPGHVSGALGLMAHWSLDGVSASLVASELPMTLIVGDHDRAVDPSNSLCIHEKAPSTVLHSIAGGHLVHEENPDAVASVMEKIIACTELKDCS